MEKTVKKCPVCGHKAPSWIIESLKGKGVIGFFESRSKEMKKIYSLSPSVQELIRTNPEYNAQEKHIAIVIENKGEICQSRDVIYDGSHLLIEYFLKHKEPYKVYHNIKKAELISLFKNPKITSIFVFAHGTRHGIKIDGQMSFYCELKGGAKKNYVAQMHCNPGGGMSSKEVGLTKKEFADNSTRTSLQNIKKIKEIIKLIDQGEIIL